MGLSCLSRNDMVPPRARERVDLRGGPGRSTFSGTQNNRIMKKYRTAWIGLLSIFIIAVAVGMARAATNLVQVRGGIGQGFTFNPSNTFIGPGDTIMWTNVSSSSHDVTHGSRAGGTNLTPYWAMINLTSTGSRSTVTFSNLGAYPYVCVQHVFTMPQP